MDESTTSMLRDSFGLTQVGEAWQYRGDGNGEIAASLNEPRGVIATFRYIDEHQPFRGLCVVVGKPPMVIIEAAGETGPYAWVISVEGERLGELCGGLMDALNLSVKEYEGCFVLRKQN